MEIELTLEQRGKSVPLRYRYTRMVNAGYVGRNCPASDGIGVFLTV
jgi:hypothetical protein